MIDRNQAIQALIEAGSKRKRSGYRNAVTIKNQHVQILPIPLCWNWSDNPNGQITRSQFEFCDSMPSSCSKKEFSSSGNSFSKNYYTFLELIKQKNFIPKSILVNNKEINEPPKVKLTSETPRGWTRVPDPAKQLRWERMWGVSYSPNDWLQSIANNLQNQQMTLTFDSAPAKIILNNTKAIDVPNDQVTRMTITASAWGRIEVYPGNWFNSSIITLTKDDQTVFKKPGFLDLAFGSDGLISCRIAEFIVAYMPSASITLKSGFLHNNNIQSDSILEVNIAGFEYTKLDSTTSVNQIKETAIDLGSEKAGLTQLTAQTSSSSANQAYIIAVILEKYGDG